MSSLRIPAPGSKESDDNATKLLTALMSAVEGLLGHRALQPGRDMGATCMVHAEAAAQHLAQAPDLRQLPVGALQAAQRPLAEDVHLGNTSPSSSGRSRRVQHMLMLLPRIRNERREGSATAIQATQMQGAAAWQQH